MGCCTHKDLDFVAPGGRKRRCTDIIFLGLFIVFLIGLFYTISWSLQYGEPNRLLYGADSYGNICGGVLLSSHSALAHPTLIVLPPFSVSRTATFFVAHARVGSELIEMGL
eukprot:m.182689 g.182689  ORF g.182689 m.182689 type:complete len:111 (-) comp14980_c0_seq2:7168-7500(-)